MLAFTLFQIVTFVITRSLRYLLLCVSASIASCRRCRLSIDDYCSHIILEARISMDGMATSLDSFSDDGGAKVLATTSCFSSLYIKNFWAPHSASILLSHCSRCTYYTAAQSMPITFLHLPAKQALAFHPRWGIPTGSLLDLLLNSNH
ncbi:hypothetical protein BKA70DRAFT_1298542, partial [Coprinopsis sp. MPI-PUGE-AT-0042]